MPQPQKQRAVFAKVQNLFKNPTAATGTGVAAVVAVVAVVAALSQDTPPQAPPSPVDPPQPPLVAAPEPPPPDEPETPPEEPSVIATTPTSPATVLGATSIAPAPTPPPPAPLPVALPQSDATWKAEFWILERFNQNELPEIPDRAPDYVREDAVIDFDWGFRSPVPEIDFPRNHFAIRWTKIEVFEEPGTYEITTVSDDGVRAYVDDKVVIDNWTNHRKATDTAQVELDTGPHELTVEYYDNNVEAEVSFEYEKVDEPASTTQIPEPQKDDGKKVALDSEHVTVLKPTSPKKPRSPRS